MGVPVVPKVPTAVLNVAMDVSAFAPVIAAVAPGIMPPTQFEGVFQFASVAPVFNQVPFAACADWLAPTSAAIEPARIRTV